MQTDTSYDLTLLDNIKPLYDKYLIDSDGFPGVFAKFNFFLPKRQRSLTLLHVASTYSRPSKNGYYNNIFLIDKGITWPNMTFLF